MWNTCAQDLSTRFTILVSQTACLRSGIAETSCCRLFLPLKFKYCPKQRKCWDTDTNKQSGLNCSTTMDRMQYESGETHKTRALLPCPHFNRLAVTILRVPCEASAIISSRGGIHPCHRPPPEVHATEDGATGVHSLKIRLPRLLPHGCKLLIVSQIARIGYN